MKNLQNFCNVEAKHLPSSKNIEEKKTNILKQTWKSRNVLWKIAITQKKNGGNIFYS